MPTEVDKKLEDFALSIFKLMVIFVKSLGYKKTKKSIGTICRLIQNYSRGLQ